MSVAWQTSFSPSVDFSGFGLEITWTHVYNRNPCKHNGINNSPPDRRQHRFRDHPDCPKKLPDILKVAAGQRIMLAGFGVGYSWGAAMNRW